MKFFHNNARFAGYTLVEVLLVLSVILILGGITFGTAAGVKSLRMKSIARAEISLIAHSLSRYKNAYGDYPITEGIEKNSITLSKSLLGWKIFQGNPAIMVDLKNAPPEGVTAFIEPSKILYEGNFPLSDKIMPRNIEFIDPWGNPYVYAYKNSREWVNYSFVLYSKGPDGVDQGLEVNGILSNQIKNLDKNVDNIYLEY